MFVSAIEAVACSITTRGVVVVGLCDVTPKDVGNGGVAVVCECQGGHSWFEHDP